MSNNSPRKRNLPRNNGNGDEENNNGGEGNGDYFYEVSTTNYKEEGGEDIKQVISPKEVDFTESDYEEYQKLKDTIDTIRREHFDPRLMQKENISEDEPYTEKLRERNSALTREEMKEALAGTDYDIEDYDRAVSEMQDLYQKIDIPIELSGETEGRETPLSKQFYGFRHASQKYDIDRRRKEPPHDESPDTLEKTESMAEGSRKYRIEEEGKGVIPEEAKRKANRKINYGKYNPYKPVGETEEERQENKEKGEKLRQLKQSQGAVQYYQEIAANDPYHPDREIREKAREMRERHGIPMHYDASDISRFFSTEDKKYIPPPNWVRELEESGEIFKDVREAGEVSGKSQEQRMEEGQEAHKRGYRKSEESKIKPIRKTSEERAKKSRKKKRKEEDPKRKKRGEKKGNPPKRTRKKKGERMKSGKEYPKK